MPKNRLLSETLILSEKVNSVSEGAEVLYCRLQLIVDDFGRYHSRPEIIKGKVLTLRQISIPTIKKRLRDLWVSGLVRLYTSNKNGEIYLEIVDFEEHQRYRSDIKRKSEYPIPVTYLDEFVTGRIEPERVVEPASCSTRVKSKEIRVKSKEKEEEDKTESIRKKVIQYFNVATGQGRSFGCAETNRLINGRIHEGRTFGQFKHVIDTKTAQWRGDLKMQKYLRPSTLFAEGNFEDYVNEPYQSPHARKEPRDSIGKTPPQTTEEKQRSDKLVALTLQCLENAKGKYQKQIAIARQNGDQVAYDEIQATIQVEASRDFNKMTGGER